MREKITSWNSETVGSGSVVNEIQFAYSNFAQVTHDYQAHASAVNTSTTPKVQYGYANGSANTVRPTTLTYPNGRALTYSYGSADSMPDALSRVASIVDDDAGSTHLAEYSYLGLSTFVEVDYTEPDIEYKLVGIRAISGGSPGQPWKLGTSSRGSWRKFSAHLKRLACGRSGKKGNLFGSHCRASTPANTIAG